jgi:hypothetical protein
MPTPVVRRARHALPCHAICPLHTSLLQVRAGNEGLLSDIGPWTMLAVNALLEPNYVADFTARVASAARVLIIPRAEWLAVRLHTLRARCHYSGLVHSPRAATGAPLEPCPT